MLARVAKPPYGMHLHSNFEAITDTCRGAAAHALETWVSPDIRNAMVSVSPLSVMISLMIKQLRILSFD